MKNNIKIMMLLLGMGAIAQAVAVNTNPPISGEPVLASVGHDGGISDRQPKDYLEQLPQDYLEQPYIYLKCRGFRDDGNFVCSRAFLEGDYGVERGHGIIRTTLGNGGQSLFPPKKGGFAPAPVAVSAPGDYWMLHDTQNDAQMPGGMVK